MDSIPVCPQQLQFDFMPRKVCCRCREQKPITAFNRCRAAPDGYAYGCRVCTRPPRPRPNLKIERRCIACHSVFFVRPCDLRKSACFYCSKACYKAHYRGAMSPCWKGRTVTRSCERCGQEFSADMTRVEKGHARFCSARCATRYASSVRARSLLEKRVISLCATCGKEISLKPSHAAQGDGRYCSKACMAQGYAQRMQGKNNHNYRHGHAIGSAGYTTWRRCMMRVNGGSHSAKEWRQLCARFGFRCACCGEKRVLTKDHIIPVSKGGRNDIDNLQPLCFPCNLAKSAHVIDYRMPG